MNENGKDPIDNAIAAADAAMPETTHPVMVAQAQLTRSGAPLRVVVPRDFRDEDVVGVIELTMQLLRSANEIRAQRPDGLVLPSRPPLTRPDGSPLS